MNMFFKLVYELVSKIIYNLVAWVVGMVGGFVVLFFTGWVDYVTIFFSYFNEFGVPLKILSVLLALVLIAIPVLLIVLLVMHFVNSIRLRFNKEDNTQLIKEIGRLNRQVLNLVDEKNKILAMKVNAMGGTERIPYMGASALMDDKLPTFANVTGGAAVGVPVAGVPVAGVPVVSDGIDPLAGLDENGNPIVGVPMAGAPVAVAGTSTLNTGSMSINASANIDGDAIANAAAAAASAAAQAQSMAEERSRASANRFAKLSLVDLKYADYDYPEFDNEISLEQFVENYRLFACSQLHLFYTVEIIRRFVAGMASSKLLILEGISGTGKTSLPYSFSRYLNNPATIISVQPSYRDRTELMGYFNEFSKRFNETEFLRALYEAGYRKDPCLVVLDEMNLARIEYYFAEMLSVLEMPSKDEWVLDLVPTAWPGDPALLENGKIRVSDHLWFIGTANNDDSTFTITDKVYDRAMPIELNERAAPFECESTPSTNVTCDHLQEMFDAAKEKYPISDATRQKLDKLDTYLQTRFKLSFGNRIMKQMNNFVPVYVACGGTELGAMDYIISRKVLKKFESMNVSFVRDEIKELIVFIEKTFGRTNMADSKKYLQRIQNLY